MTAVIGLDPSLSSTGIAIDNREAWTVHTEPGDPERLAVIYDAVYCTLTTPGVELAVLEDLPSHAKAAGLTGMAQGVIRLACINAQVPYLTVPPATLKTFGAGKGNATKADLRMEWFKRTAMDVRDDNQVDALVLQELGLHMVGRPSLELPQTHTRALAKLSLPDRPIRR